MISTKYLISSVNEVPREWVFEHYCSLSETLTGQRVTIKSLFNTADKTPSMFIYYDGPAGFYKYKDFSTGKHGDGVSLVLELFKLKGRGEAAHKIIEAYNQYRLNNKGEVNLREFKVHSKYQLSEVKERGWTNLDEKYWTQFYIGSKLLEQYRVKPLEMYKMSKIDDSGEEKILTIQGHYIYGYYRKDGTLYKIYQPYVKTNKFVKVHEYIQGTDQLTMTKPYLIITSSLKDLMAFNKLGFSNAESVAPDSENTLISENVMISYKHKYKGICTLFDNDTAGIEAMEKYQKRYDLPFVYLKLSKDLSDSIKDHGLLNVKSIITPMLKDVLVPKEIPILVEDTNKAPF